MWVEFVVGSHPCSERFFSGYSSFPLSSKTNISKFQFDLDYCQALSHEPLAREIAQALPVLLTLNKLQLQLILYQGFKGKHLVCFFQCSYWLQSSSTIARRLQGSCQVSIKGKLYKAHHLHCRNTQFPNR